MSMLKSSIAKALAAAIALSAGTAAFAANGPNEGGNTDLFVAVWNPSTSTSYVQDLGSSFAMSQLDTTFSASAGFSTTATLDGGNLSTALGAGTYNYSLFAGDMTIAGGSFNTFTGNIMYLSQTTTTGTPFVENNGSIFSAGGQATGNYIDKFVSGAATSSTQVDNGQANSGYWASTSAVGNPRCDFTIGAFPGCAVTGTNLALGKYVGLSESAADPTQSNFVGNSAGAGLFTLNGSVLSYNLAAVGGSPVPLPAAAWLLVSGLLGLGAVGRRRKAEAAGIAA
jgi:hypothetical protein